VNGIQHLCAWGWTQKWTFKGEKGKPGLRALPTSMTLVMLPPHVFGPKYERLQRTRNSQGFRIGENRGNLSNDTRRSRCHLLESVYGPCGWQRYCELNTPKSKVMPDAVALTAFCLPGIWKLAFVFGLVFSFKGPGTLSSCNKYTVKSADTSEKLYSDPPGARMGTSLWLFRKFPCSHAVLSGGVKK